MRSVGHLLFRSAGQSDGLVTNSHSYVLFPMEDVVYGLSFCFKFDICAEGCSDKCQHFWRGCRFEHIAEQGDNLDDRFQVIMLFGEYALLNEIPDEEDDEGSEDVDEDDIV